MRALQPCSQWIVDRHGLALVPRLKLFKLAKLVDLNNKLKFDKMQGALCAGAGLLTRSPCMFIRVVTASILILTTAISSEARPLRAPPPECNVIMPCDFSSSLVRTQRSTRPVQAGQPNAVRGLRMSVASSDTRGTEIVGGRPAGCPRSFCGCGAAIRVFGRIVPELNLAANWLRFPRVSPAPGMAAARRGHVFVLERHIAGDIWIAYDANSGGHVTRIHARSVRGYTVVNPRSA